jgi:hypothetical protein
MPSPCPRCGLTIRGTHATADDCLRHLAPRYQLAQRSLEAMHSRYRSMEDRLERAKIQARVARQDARSMRTLTGRVLRLERVMGLDARNA